MARVCTVCRHPLRAEIDRGLLARVPLRALAGRFGLSTTALHRHKQAHIPAALAQAQGAQELAQAEALLSQAQGLLAQALKVLNEAEARGDYKTALQGIREARGLIALLAGLGRGQSPRPGAEFLMSPKWWRTRSALLEALEPYPEIRAAVAQRLLALEAETEE